MKANLQMPPQRKPEKDQKATGSLPLVSHGGGQLWHGSHGKKHDAQERNTKNGSRPRGSFVDTTEQGSNDQGHNHHLNQPVQKQPDLPIRASQ